MLKRSLVSNVLSVVWAWDQFRGHAKFAAAPVCPFRSNARDRFFDAQRHLCVELDYDDQVTPLSAPCPPGSLREEDKFLCKGLISTAWEMKCKSSSPFFPFRPYFANKDYQCIQAMIYTPRPSRCPIGFRLKKLIDRYGTTPGRLAVICISEVVVPAAIKTLDPIISRRCEVLAQERTEERFVEPEKMVSSQLVDLEVPYADCVPISVDKVAVCPMEGGILVRASSVSWNCEKRVHVYPELDPVNCKDGYWWSTEFLACLRLDAYAGPKQCPADTKPSFRRSGVTRRTRRVPRYTETSFFENVNDYECLADSAIPDFPYCPESYWLDLSVNKAAPRCFREYTSEPTYICEAVENSTLITSEKETTCEITWNEGEYASSPPQLTKRELKNTKLLMRKSVESSKNDLPPLTPYEIQMGFDELENMLAPGIKMLSGELAWEDSVDAASIILDRIPTHDLTYIYESLGFESEP